MPLRATRNDGVDHPGAALKSRSRSLLALARLAVCSACLFQGIVKAVFVVVVRVIADQPAEMLFVQCDDVVQDFPPATSDPALRYSILPGRLDARPLGFQTRRRQKGDDLIVELRVSIQDDETVWASFWKGLA